MHTTRRQFLDSLAVSATALAVAPTHLPAALSAIPADIRLGVTPDAAQGAWDTRWPDKLTGKVRTVFDVPEIESGYGVWRATIWARQYEAVLGIPQRELSTALVLRHNAIILAMQQGFWDKYGIGKSKGVTHPLTGEATERNPALLGASDGLPEPMQGFALPAFIARGGVALACDLALQDMVGIIQSTDKVPESVAKEQAKNWLVPGVILQPSGVFAVLRAQQAQALYIRAS
jgi:hypothetical protein